MKKPEILAPCGTWQALEAAIKGGADAVYLGGTLFSARAFAGNFDKEEMLRAIDHCHFYDVRIYMALNTLLKENEIPAVRDYMEPFVKAGLDGVIVQDFGVARVLRDNFPDIPLHASTQMSVSGSCGARFLKDCGFTRIVPARELSLEEIKSIKEKADIEIETFVHGAMCFAYSGKCLMSSFLGGRSGNRGRCAQPCRQCWEMKGDGITSSGYLLSMKDMCTIDILPQLIEAGIDSFKIEGRMKKPEYVAMVSAAYKAAVEMYFEDRWNEKNIDLLTEQMKDIYNRGGFSSGYYFRQNGKEMLSIKRPNHTGVKIGTVLRTAPPKVFIRLEKDVNAQDVLEIRDEGPSSFSPSNRHASGDTVSGIELTTPKAESAGSVLALNGKDFKKIKPGMSVYRMRNNRLIDQIKRDLTDPEKFVEANALVELRVGKPLQVSIWKDDISVSVTGADVTEAKNRPCDEQMILEKMQKTGGSQVRLIVSCNTDPNAFIQMSELNSLRRRAVSEFKTAMAQRYRRS